ncbi:MAG: phosphatidate cytidylyltransferase [Candidatus Fimenecus sp.]
MVKRIVVGVIAALIAIGIIALRNTPVLPVALAFLSCVATYEIEKCVQLKNKAVMGVSLVFSALVPVYYTYASTLAECGITLPVTSIVVIYVLAMFILMLTDYKNTKFEDIAAVLVASIFVPWAFSTLAMLCAIDKQFPEYFDGHHGVFYILFALFCALISDTFAYFTGKFFGKHKLTEISPKKTVEGAVGGVVGAVISCVILFAIFDNCFFTVHTVTYLEVILMSLVLAVIGICGDLSASVIKRNFGIKDFGNLFPGHGGVMDRCDSILFVSTALYALIVLTRTVF